MDKIEMLLQLVTLSSDIEKINYGYLFKLKKNILIYYNRQLNNYNELILYDDEIILRSESKCESIIQSEWSNIEFRIK